MSAKNSTGTPGESAWEFPLPENSRLCRWMVRLSRGDAALTAPIREGAEGPRARSPAHDLAAAGAQARLLQDGKSGRREGVLHFRRHAFFALDAVRLLCHVL